MKLNKKFKEKIPILLYYCCEMGKINMNHKLEGEYYFFDIGLDGDNVILVDIHVEEDYYTVDGKDETSVKSLEEVIKYLIYNYNYYKH